MDDFQNGLRRRINERIKTRGFCVVYDNDLRRLSQPLAELRDKQIRKIHRFAAENGLAVTLRDIGLNAPFTKAHCEQIARPLREQLKTFARVLLRKASPCKGRRFGQARLKPIWRLK
jgi:hypothetical protein